MAKDITLKTRNGETRYPKSVTDLIFENGTGKTLQTIITELRQVDSDTDIRTRMFKADVTNLDTLNKKTDIGLYNYVGNGWRGAVSINYDSADNVSQVALSSSTPSYNGNTLTWISAQPCAMARTYKNGAWSHWEKVGAPVVNDLTTGGTDKALSAEMGKTLKEGLAALGPKLSQINSQGYDGEDSKIIIGESELDPTIKIEDKVINFFGSVKKNGEKVLTESDLDGYAKTEDIPDIGEEGTYSHDEEISWGNDANTETYGKLTPQGILAKGYYDINGDKIPFVKRYQDLVENVVENGNPIALMKDTGFASIMATWGFIGDSLSSGVPCLRFPDIPSSRFSGAGKNFYKYSWGQFFCREHGLEGTNFSNGGQTTWGWLDMYPNKTVASRYTTSVGYESVSFSAMRKTAYAIMLGVNDAAALNPSSSTYDSTKSIGTMSNVHVNDEDYTAADLLTFAGAYGKIIVECRKASPSCRIFVITTPLISLGQPPETNGLNALIRQMPNVFDSVYLVDFATYFVNNAYAKSLFANNDHMTPLGYHYFARAFDTYLDYIIRENHEDFDAVCGIDTIINDDGSLL